MFIFLGKKKICNILKESEIFLFKARRLSVTIWRRPLVKNMEHIIIPPRHFALVSFSFLFFSLLPTLLANYGRCVSNNPSVYVIVHFIDSLIFTISTLMYYIPYVIYYSMEYKFLLLKNVFLKFKFCYRSVIYAALSYLYFSGWIFPSHKGYVLSFITSWLHPVNY